MAVTLLSLHCVIKQKTIWQNEMNMKSSLTVKAFTVILLSSLTGLPADASSEDDSVTIAVPSPPSPSLLTLPDELITQIMDSLDQGSLVSLCAANTKFSDLGLRENQRRFGAAPLILQSRSLLPLMGRWLEDDTFRDTPLILTQDLKKTPEKDKFTDHDLVFLTNAHSLDLSWCLTLSDEGLSHLANVITINLYGYSQITGKGLASLGSARDVNLHGCFRLCDDDLVLLSHVQTLTLTFCGRVTDNGLAHLTHVRTLDLTDCNVRGETLLSLQNLIMVNITRCLSITRETKGILHASTIDVVEDIAKAL